MACERCHRGYDGRAYAVVVRGIAAPFEDEEPALLRQVVCLACAECLAERLVDEALAV